MMQSFFRSSGALRRHVSKRLFGQRYFSTPVDLSKLRNIGISAHIDSGKTTLTERILFYTGRVRDIHEVRGKDGVGAKMDSMELEKEKGITIQSAATYTTWGDSHVNIIDTPGHVDFTIEVERALRVLDGAVLVICAVSGIQSQSITVDRQMKRYDVPRVAFINKLDRMGATPWKPIDGLRNILQHNAAAVQIPMGVESEHNGVIDLVTQEAIFFEGPKGETVTRKGEFPSEYADLVEEKRAELIEKLADVDEQIEEIFLEEREPTVEELKAAIRRCTINLSFTPVFMGSAFKNKGVQPLLDGVIDYLPSPTEVRNEALDLAKDEERVTLLSDPTKPFVGLAFKLEEGRYGQLTYIRVYQGTLKKGMVITDSVTGKKIKVPRVVRMHSNEMEDVDDVSCGEIVAMFGVDCVSGTTFTSSSHNLKLSMTSMFVPDPVISLSIKPKNNTQSQNFTKALQKFTREDPTFRVSFDADSQETLISGMGELHLDIYAQRLEREYNVETVLGAPKVAYRESPTMKAEFDYTHKKQTGGAGQFGKVIGYLEPVEDDGTPEFKSCQFSNQLSGNNVPPEYHGAIEKGFNDSIAEGCLTGNPVQGVKFVIQDGAAHSVDSSELAFRTATQHAFRAAFRASKPVVLEPLMRVSCETPTNFQGPVVAQLNRRMGQIVDVVGRNDGLYTIVTADVPLSKMFGYSTDLRSITEGKGEFAMEYKEHASVPMSDQLKLCKDYEENRGKKVADDM